MNVVTAPLSSAFSISPVTLLSAVVIAACLGYVVVDVLDKRPATRADRLADGPQGQANTAVVAVDRQAPAQSASDSSATDRSGAAVPPGHAANREKGNGPGAAGHRATGAEASKVTLPKKALPSTSGTGVEPPARLPAGANDDGSTAPPRFSITTTPAATVDSVVAGSAAATESAASADNQAQVTDTDSSEPAVEIPSELRFEVQIDIDEKQSVFCYPVVPGEYPCKCEMSTFYKGILRSFEVTERCP